MKLCDIFTDGQNSIFRSRVWWGPGCINYHPHYYNYKNDNNDIELVLVMVSYACNVAHLPLLTRFKVLLAERRSAINPRIAGRHFPHNDQRKYRNISQGYGSFPGRCLVYPGPCVVCCVLGDVPFAGARSKKGGSTELTRLRRGDM